MKKIFLFTLLSLLLLCSFASATTLNDDVITYFTMDATGTQTSIAPDGTACSETAAAVSTSGKISNSLDFQSGDYYTCSGQPLLDDTTVWSMSLWINADSYSSDYGFGAINFAKSSTQNAEIKFCDSGNGSLCLKTAAATNTVISQSTLSASAWYHVVVNINGTSIETYINGQSDYNSTSAGTIKPYLGNFGLGDRFWNGRIDELGIFNRTLTNLEANYLYNSNSPTTNQRYIFTNLPVPTPSISHFEITANINNFSAIVNGTNYTTTNGTINTPILDNTTDLIDIIASPNSGILTEPYLNYNVSSNLDLSFVTLNITAYDIIAGENVQNFTLELLNNTLGVNITNSTTNFYKILYLTQNTSFNISIDSAAYAILTRGLTITNETSQSYEMLLPYANSINISIFSQETGALITENVSIYLQGEEFQQTNETDDGNFFVYGLDAGAYNILFTSDNYSNANYPITVSSRSYQTLNAYMLESGENSVVFTVKDDVTKKAQAGAVVAVERIINNQWTTISAIETDIAGQIQYFYEANINYRFTISKAGYDDKIFNLNPIIFNSYNVWLEPTGQTADAGDYQGVSIVKSSEVFFNNANNTLNITFTSPAGEFQEYGFALRYGNATQSAYGVNAYGGTLSRTLEVTNATFGDTISLSYYYTLSSGETKNYQEIYNIEDLDGRENTFYSNRGKTYGLGLFERVLIICLVVIVFGGVAFGMGGYVAAGIAMEFALGAFIYIQLVSTWALAASMIILLLLTMWGASR